MAIQQLPSGRYRATIKDPETGQRVSAARVLGDDPETYRLKTEARTACDKALAKLKADAAASKSPTLKAWAERWSTDPLFARPKESTNIHNAERIKPFVERYGHLRLDQIDDGVVAEFLAGGKNNGRVKVLCAFFNDAASRKAGRLIAFNPFGQMGLGKGDGRKREKPPTKEQVWALIGAARRVASPDFAAWLQVACFTGMRPGELDALRWEDIDFEGGWINVDEQFNATTRTFTAPKNGETRKAPMHRQAREALMAQPRGAAYDFCFVNLQGEHWTPSSRAYHWNATRAAVGWTKSLYLATRHFAGAMMRVEMRLDDEIVGHALGHTGRDVGKLVREVYGHLEAETAMERVKEAYEGYDWGDGLRAA